mmetsp:Transcript_1108/g.2702  ORF Transcript_1108/g.2702 Transcript_1108/m.2702 type:complete len:281 (+) Transcript_1108:513-1355(+)
MNHAIHILLHLLKELRTRLILLASSGLILPSPLIIAGHNHLSRSTCHLKFFAELAFLVGVIEAKSRLKFGDELFVSVFLFAFLATGCLFGTADTFSFGLIQLRLSLEHALLSLSSPVHLLRGLPATRTNMQWQHLFHCDGRYILTSILHIGLLGHWTRRKVIVRQCIQLRTQVGEQVFHLILGSIFLRLLLMCISIVSACLLEVLPLVQLAQSQFGFFLADIWRISSTTFQANIWQFSWYDVIPILIKDAFFYHCFDVSGMLSGQNRWRLKCHFEFGCGV